MRVYLCGPINGCSDDEATTWRQWFKQFGLNVNYIDPMRRDYRGKEQQNYREIVELDKQDIRDCDAVLVMFSKPSVGTSMEVFFAWTLEIPVIVINESGEDVSPWLRYHATVIVPTKQDACRELTAV